MSSRDRIKKRKVEAKENYLCRFETQNIKTMKNNVVNKFTEVFVKKEKHTLKRKQRSSSFAIPKEV